MQNMVEAWEAMSFHHHAYRESDVSILTAVDEIQSMLDDQIVKTQTMRGSPFIKPFEAEIKVIWLCPQSAVFCIVYIWILCTINRNY